MVAYSFQGMFVDPIEAGTKGGTIRTPRTPPSRHARPGEELQLYHKQRHPSGFLIAKKPCCEVEPIRLRIFDDAPSVRLGSSDENGGRLFIADRQRLDLFARFDGFEDFAQLRAFWRRTHPGVDVFFGIHIRWLPLPAEVEAA